MARTQAAGSLEYVLVPVSATKAGVAFNPTVDPVKMAFKTVGVDPVTSDFVTADWETVGTTYYARCLVGPGGGAITLTAGTYTVWLQITDSPEVVVRAADSLVIV